LDYIFLLTSYYAVLECDRRVTCEMNSDADSEINFGVGIFTCYCV
jgi:hypothetical protein